MQHTTHVGDTLLRVRDILGSRKDGTPGIIPVSKSTWWQWVRDGRAPQPVRLHGATCWRASDIQRLVVGEANNDTPSDGTASPEPSGWQKKIRTLGTSEVVR